MRIVPRYEWNHIPLTNKTGGLASRSKQPVLPEEINEGGNQLGRLQQDSHHPERIALDSRVLIIEGISGSGKDTFQTHLKKMLKGRRDVYDYSEGDVLHSWKQLQIEGILKLRVNFMKLFVNYMRDILSRDENAVFLLNRFHLSTYASTIVQQPKLEKEYDEIINVLRTLPVHVFILQLDENDIEKRSRHPERSGAWQKFQQRIAGKDSFRNRLERQQRLILDAAKRQQIPYSVIKLAYELEVLDGRVRISKAPSIVHGRTQTNTADAKISRRKPHIPAPLYKD